MFVRNIGGVAFGSPSLLRFLFLAFHDELCGGNFVWSFGFFASDSDNEGMISAAG